jgi:DNA-binding MltR family transcriptional regulator
MENQRKNPTIYNHQLHQRQKFSSNSRKEWKNQQKMIGYADDCIVHIIHVCTSHKLPRLAEARLKKAANKLVKMDLEYQPRNQSRCSFTEETES